MLENQKQSVVTDYKRLMMHLGSVEQQFDDMLFFANGEISGETRDILLKLNAEISNTRERLINIFYSNKQ